MGTELKKAETFGVVESVKVSGCLLALLVLARSPARLPHLLASPARLACVAYSLACSLTRLLYSSTNTLVRHGLSERVPFLIQGPESPTSLPPYGIAERAPDVESGYPLSQPRTSDLRAIRNFASTHRNVSTPAMMAYCSAFCLNLVCTYLACRQPVMCTPQLAERC